MKRIPLSLLTLLTLGLAAVSTALIAQEGEMFEFSHKVHVLENEMLCEDCHAGVAGSEVGTDNLLPAKNICLDCHEESEIVAYDLVQRVENYSPMFSHKRHVAADVDCNSCHTGIEVQEVSTQYVLPNMLACMDCHDSRAVTNDCYSCHQEFEDLRPVSHLGDFEHQHGQLAKQNEMKQSADMSCQTCHETSFCQECHEGENLDRTTHPLNYEFTHALEATNRERECVTCHTEREFCITCHAENQVLPRNHTVGWVNNFPNDGGRHRVEALNDIDACISCHEQNAAQLCQRCHDGR